MLTLIRCPFHTLVTAVARKGPRSFCQKCRWQVTPEHAYTLDPTMSEWADYAAVQTQCGNLSGNQLTRNSSGNTRSQSSQHAVPLWTDPGIKSGISVGEIISILNNNKKKRRRGMNCRTSSQNPRARGKSHHHHHIDQTEKQFDMKHRSTCRSHSAKYQLGREGTEGEGGLKLKGKESGSFVSAILITLLDEN